MLEENKYKISGCIVFILLWLLGYQFYQYGLFKIEFQQLCSTEANLKQKMQLKETILQSKINHDEIDYQRMVELLFANKLFHILKVEPLKTEKPLKMNLYLAGDLNELIYLFNFLIKGNNKIHVEQLNFSTEEDNPSILCQISLDAFSMYQMAETDYILNESKKEIQGQKVLTNRTNNSLTPTFQLKIQQHHQEIIKYKIPTR
jgi:hypothetical protein